MIPQIFRNFEINTAVMLKNDFSELETGGWGRGCQACQRSLSANFKK